MVKQFKDKASISKLCKWASLPQSVFYYRPQDGKHCVKPSTHTVMKDGRVLPNEKVVEDIKLALCREFCCYGYHNITDDLHDLGYIVNHKKVYRLMAENNFTLNAKISFIEKRCIISSINGSVYFKRVDRIKQKSKSVTAIIL
jgi:putative transposase